MTAISKNVFFEVLHDIVNKYNNTVHRTINTKPKFKVDNNVRISKYKNIFAKGCSPNWSEEAFVISKIKNIVPWT